MYVIVVMAIIAVKLGLQHYLDNFVIGVSVVKLLLERRAQRCGQTTFN